MEIQKNAIAGTLESSDAQVTIEPYSSGIKIDLESSVMNQYGRKIHQLILDTLEELEVKNAYVVVIDKGALDCTLKARIQAAVFRSQNEEVKIPWGGSVK